MQYVWDRAVIINIVNIHIFPYIFSWRVTVYESFSIVWSRMDYFFMWMPQSRWILPNTLYFKLRYSPSNLLIRLADASSFFLAFIFQSINLLHIYLRSYFLLIIQVRYITWKTDFQVTRTVAMPLEGMRMPFRHLEDDLEWSSVTADDYGLLYLSWSIFVPALNLWKSLHVNITGACSRCQVI